MPGVTFKMMYLTFQSTYDFQEVNKLRHLNQLHLLTWHNLKRPLQSMFVYFCSCRNMSSVVDVSCVTAIILYVDYVFLIL